MKQSCLSRLKNCIAKIRTCVDNLQTNQLALCIQLSRDIRANFNALCLWLLSNAKVESVNIFKIGNFGTGHFLNLPLLIRYATCCLVVA